MPTNLEIKARVKNLNKLKTAVRELCNSDEMVIRQEDIFFNTNEGRLKLRTFPDGTGELIFYNREDSPGLKVSEYIIYKTENPEILKQLLEAAFSIRGIVRKKRLLYLLGSNRIHLDEVENLGSFIELELILDENQDEEKARQIANELIARLGIKEEDLINKAYIDLFEETSTKK